MSQLFITQLIKFRQHLSAYEVLQYQYVARKASQVQSNRRLQAVISEYQAHALTCRQQKQDYQIAKKAFEAAEQKLHVELNAAVAAQNTDAILHLSTEAEKLIQEWQKRTIIFEETIGAEQAKKRVLREGKLLTCFSQLHRKKQEIYRLAGNLLKANKACQHILQEGVGFARKEIESAIPLRAAGFFARPLAKESKEHQRAAATVGVIAQSKPG